VRAALCLGAALVAVRGHGFEGRVPPITRASVWR
jgi:hypothetical protein